MAIGSLINLPFEPTQKEVAALFGWLKPDGKVLFLGYPYERFLASGARDGAQFGKSTDGERTPWAEWYDRDKISRLFGKGYSVSLAVNFGKDNAEFNFFELNKAAALPEAESALFPEHPLAAIPRIDKSGLAPRLRNCLPEIAWEDSAALPLPPAYDDLLDAPVLRYLYHNFRPRRHLEFGTWKGKGARRVIDESQAAVWTVNLWEGETKRDGSWAYGESYKDRDFAGCSVERDGGAVRTDARGMIGLEYLEAGLGSRVSQIYSDSRLWDDEAYPDAFFDSVFVDGGHDAATSRADLYKALRLLRPGGLLLCHDFCPLPEVNAQFPSTVGVTGMLADELPDLKTLCDALFHVEDTWLLCGVRRRETGEEQKRRERALFAQAKTEGLRLAALEAETAARGNEAAVKFEDLPADNAAAGGKGASGVIPKDVPGEKAAANLIMVRRRNPWVRIGLRLGFVRRKD
jgi:SAM-dependent methyltransferase